MQVDTPLVVKQSQPVSCGVRPSGLTRGSHFESGSCAPWPTPGRHQRRQLRLARHDPGVPGDTAWGGLTPLTEPFPRRGLPPCRVNVELSAVAYRLE